MRTTITLDPEAESLVRRLMREKGIGFKQAVNDAIVRGLSPQRQRHIDTPTFDLGTAHMEVNHVLRLSADLEDEALLAKRELGK